MQRVSRECILTIPPASFAAALDTVLARCRRCITAWRVFAISRRPRQSAEFFKSVIRHFGIFISPAAFQKRCREISLPNPRPLSVAEASGDHPRAGIKLASRTPPAPILRPGTADLQCRHRRPVLMIKPALTRSPRTCTAPDANHSDRVFTYRRRSLSLDYRRKSPSPPAHSTPPRGIRPATPRLNSPGCMSLTIRNGSSKPQRPLVEVRECIRCLFCQASAG